MERCSRASAVARLAGWRTRARCRRLGGSCAGCRAWRGRLLLVGEPLLAARGSVEATLGGGRSCWLSRLLGAELGFGRLQWFGEKALVTGAWLVASVFPAGQRHPQDPRSRQVRPGPASLATKGAHQIVLGQSPCFSCCCEL